MTRFTAVNLDLSQLPAPQVVKVVDFESILAERLASMVTRFTDAGIEFDVAGLETDPAVILQQEDAYRETLDLAAINDAARAVMLPFATGGDLDNLAAFYGIARLTLTPATDTTDAVMEPDDDLRVRTQLAPEALPYAGLTGGGYRLLALNTAPSLKDVTPLKRSGGRVDLVLLGRTGNGLVGSDIVSAVYTAFQDDAATQLTDIVSVRSTTILPFTVTVKLKLRLGPDPAAVKAIAKSAIEAYVASRHRVGKKVYVQMIAAVAAVGGVETVIVEGPLADIVPALDETAYCTSVTVTHEVVE